MGVTFVAVAAETRLAEQARAAIQSLAALHRRVQKKTGGVSEAQWHGGKEGMPTGFFVTHPLDPREDRSLGGH